MPQPFTLEMFAKEIGSSFSMKYGEGGTAQLELRSAQDLSPSPKHVQFSLIFLGPESCPIEQKIYELDHEQLGTLNLFLVPIGKTAKGVEYEAIFNLPAN